MLRRTGRVVVAPAAGDKGNDRGDGGRSPRHDDEPVRRGAGHRDPQSGRTSGLGPCVTWRRRLPLRVIVQMCGIRVPGVPGCEALPAGRPSRLKEEAVLGLLAHPPQAAAVRTDGVDLDGRLALVGRVEGDPPAVGRPVRAARIEAARSDSVQVAAVRVQHVDGRALRAWPCAVDVTGIRVPSGATAHLRLPALPSRGSIARHSRPCS